MEMVMMLRRMRNPTTPQENKIALSTRYQAMGTALVSPAFTLALLPPRQHNGAHDGDEDQHRRDFEGQQEVAEQQAPNFFWSADEIAQVDHAGAAAQDVCESGNDDGDGGES